MNCQGAVRFAAGLLAASLFTAAVSAQNSKTHNPTWWDKYQYVANNGFTADGGSSIFSVAFGSNVDVSNECGPQSETFITLNTNKPKLLAGGECFLIEALKVSEQRSLCGRQFHIGLLATDFSRPHFTVP